jgi:hypothetical protein
MRSHRKNARSAAANRKSAVGPRLDRPDRADVALEGHGPHRGLDQLRLTLDARVPCFLGRRELAQLELDLVLALEHLARAHVDAAGERDRDPFLPDRPVRPCGACRPPDPRAASS